MRLNQNSFDKYNKQNHIILKFLHYFFFSENSYLLQSNIVVPEPLCRDLVLFTDLNAWLFEDLQPWVSQGLPDTHPLLWFVDQEVSNKVFCLPRNVLPQLKVKINVTHLNTLKSFTIVLKKTFLSFKKSIEQVVVYFDQLLDAAITQKLAEILFLTVSTFFVDFRSCCLIVVSTTVFSFHFFSFSYSGVCS